MNELGWQAWYTITVLAGVLLGLVRGRMQPDMLLLAGLVAVGVVGIISPAEMVSGFANPGMLTVGALFVVAQGLRETGALDRAGRRMFGNVRSERTLLARLAPQVAGLSAFLSNTAVVAMLLPIVSDWARQRRVAPSRVLLPLSYLAILGGTCTLIGTSTNLIVSELMAAGSWGTTNGAALDRLGFFELAWIGAPMALLGMAYLLTVGRRLLPDRRDLLEQLGDSAREYLADIQVMPDCPLIGKTIERANLRHLPGLFLVEIVRDDQVIAPVEPNERLHAGDRLSFAGVVSTIVELERIPGFVHIAEDDRPPQSDQQEEGAERRFCEAVVSSTSPLIERNIRESNFRALYNAAVVAVHRGGARLSGRVGDIVLRAGDTLLLQTGPNFAAAHRNNPDFFLVSSFEDSRPIRRERAWIALSLLAVLIVLMASGWAPPLLASFLIAGLMVATRCISHAEARRNIPWNVLLAIAASIGLGRALENSGVATALATAIVETIGQWGPLAALAAVYVATVICTELVTNNAAAVLIFPLALAVASQLGVSPRPFIIALTFAASASFLTPMGYQTNMMVFGPGGYRLRDMLRVGLPLSILMLIGALLLIPRVWTF